MSVGRSAVPAAAPEAVIAAALGALEAAADDEQLSRRIGVVGAIVSIALTDVPGRELTLRLDRTPIEVADGADGHAPVRLTMSTCDLHELFVGGRHLAMKIAVGQVAYAGAVRRFLRVVPILSQLQPAYLDQLNGAPRHPEAC